MLQFSLLALLALLSACTDSTAVSLYVALDQEHSELMIKRFEQETGQKVRANFDTEASKTVSLVSAIIEEAGRPRCDVFWNNELAQTVRLAQKGLLAPYQSPSAEKIPAQWRDGEHRWTGFAARARVLIVNTKRLPDRKDWPRSIWDLTEPKWKGKCGVARPLTGTTLTHFAALHVALGDAEFQRWIDGLDQNDVVWLQSNGATMRSVRDGELDFALTDTDDFHVALQKGFPVDCVFPDQQQGGMGTMLIPNSVAIITNGPRRQAAEKLVDFILSESTEAALAAADSAQIPLRQGVPGPKAAAILKIDQFRAMQWDPAKTAQGLDSFVKQMQQRSFGK